MGSGIHFYNSPDLQYFLFQLWLNAAHKGIDFHRCGICHVRFHFPLSRVVVQDLHSHWFPFCIHHSMKSFFAVIPGMSVHHFVIDPPNHCPPLRDRGCVTSTAWCHYGTWRPNAVLEWTVVDELRNLDVVQLQGNPIDKARIDCDDGGGDDHDDPIPCRMISTYPGIKCNASVWKEIK